MALENIRENRDIRLVAKEERRNCLVTEPNYHTIKEFSQHLLAIEIKTKTKVKMNQPIYLGLSIANHLNSNV